jgi:hypothetical protein
MRNAFDTAKAQIFGYPDLPLKRTSIAKLPYASMTARVGKGPQALLILGRIENGVEHWISGIDRSILALREGRIVKTFGFPENLKDTRSPFEDPVNRLLHKLDEDVRHVRYLDFDKNQSYGLPVESTFHKLGERKIEIVEIEFDTVLVVERSRATAVPWEFENFYWVDPGDGFVWKSRQYIARSFPPVEFEILKPPGV